MIIRTILFEVVKDAIRKKILYFIFLLTFFLLALTPKLPSFEVGVQIALYRDISLGLSLISIVLLSIFLSVNQIPGEIEKKTIYNILSKPIKRYQFLIAKFLGILSILALASLLIGFIISVIAYFYFQQFDFSFFPAIYTIFLEGVLISAFIFFISSFSTPIISAFGSILFYFAGHVKDDLTKLLIEGMESNSFPYYTIKSFSYMLPNLELFNFNEIVARGVQIPPSTLLQVSLYSLVYSALFIVLASLIFSKKDL